MKIFLDCGAWTGASVDYFLKHYPGAKEFKIHSFECLPENLHELRKRNVTVHNKAVWVSKGFHRFYKGQSESGSLYKEKTTGGVNPNNFIIVRTIDIAQFIKKFKDDYIVIKLNIEGAEYEVIPHMKDCGVLDLVNEWFIQWHWDKIRLSFEKHNRISQMIKWKPWLAMFDK